jgi:putative methionine-R-sulfoxide reductase with GAF domain
MAKKSKIVRELHLRKIVGKYSSKRKELKAIIKDTKTSLEEKQKAKDILKHKLPKLVFVSFIIAFNSFLLEEYFPTIFLKCNSRTIFDFLAITLIPFLLDL